MGIQRTLGEGEYVVLNLRTHVKALLGPFIVLLVIVVGWTVLAFVIPDSSFRKWIHLTIAAIVAIVLVWLVILPVLRWWASRYTFTNRRLITREGIFNRTGRDIPLHRINDIAYEKSVLDRMLGCGTLIISDATEKAGLVLPDLPRVEDVHVTLSNLLFRADDGSDDGEFPPNEPPRGPRGHGRS